jgi:hypothetical protein
VQPRRTCCRRFTNTQPIDAVNGATQSLPGVIGLPQLGLPPIPQIPLTPEQAEALIPDDLLARVQKYAFGNGQVAAPPCRKQGKYTFGGETTQYPHVNARRTSGG